MKVAVIIIVIVLTVLGCAIWSLRGSARKGMPSQDVLDRATQRARELEAQEKAEDRRDS